MSHKVKLLGVRGDCFDLLVDGVRCSYLIQRPQPLSTADAVMLRSVMDTNILESMTRASLLESLSEFARASGWVRPLLGPWARAARLFSGVWKPRDKVPLLCETIAGYIEKVGIEVEPEKGVKIVAILKSDIDKIRKGRI